jgi:WD40 repeat protein
MLASGSADKVILTWKFSTGESLLAFKGHKGTVYAVKLAGHLLVSGSADRTVKVLPRPLLPLPPPLFRLLTDAIPPLGLGR